MFHIPPNLRQPLVAVFFTTSTLMYAAMPWLGSCLLNDNRCDKYEVARQGDLTICECVPGTVRDPRGYGCLPCGDNEVVKENKCTCKDGFARNTPDGACLETMLGASCSDDNPCASAFPRCVANDAGGYCTTEGCDEPSSCTGDGWACNKTGATSYCERPPSGNGTPCLADSECASFEADYCEKVQSKTCLVQGCATGEKKCFGDYACCDFTFVGIPSLCVPQVALSADGKCPINAPLVTP
jgi:hypothetical protein